MRHLVSGSGAPHSWRITSIIRLIFAIWLPAIRAVTTVPETKPAKAASAWVIV